MSVAHVDPKHNVPPWDPTEKGLYVDYPLEPTPQGLRGARVALGQMDSLSGYLAPVWWLERQGVKLQDLGEVVFAANHSHAVALLGSGRVDVAATFEPAMKAWLKKNPGARDVQVLKRFNKLPNAVVVTRASMGASERAALLQQLQRVFTAPELEHARDGLKAGAAIDGLAPAGAEVLESVDAWLD